MLIQKVISVDRVLLVWELLQDSIHLLVLDKLNLNQAQQVGNK
jgi:hypothetical protein